MAMYEFETEGFKSRSAANKVSAMLNEEGGCDCDVVCVLDEITDQTIYKIEGTTSQVKFKDYWENCENPHIDFVSFSMMKDEKRILTRPEMDYIHDVVAPFWTNVASVRLKSRRAISGGCTFDQIVITYYVEDPDPFVGTMIKSSVNLELFVHGEKFNGMEPDKEYTLKELGLDFEE